jgi:hypothetical protein
MINAPATADFIASKISFVRAEKVLLDFDLASLYGVEAKRLKEAVRRNIRRFPDDFMFVLGTERVEYFKDAICVLKHAPGKASKVSALGIYRTGDSDAFRNSQQPKGNRNKYRHHAHICCFAKANAIQQGTGRKDCTAGKEVRPTI